MTSESSTGLWCEWLSCDNEAWYRVSAQWSPFDWMHFYTCIDHLPYAEAWLTKRRVDGELPIDVTTVTLEITDEVAGQGDPRR